MVCTPIFSQKAVSKNPEFQQTEDESGIITVNCLMPTEFLSAGKVSVSIFGYDATSKIRITVPSISVTLSESGFKEGGAVEEPSPTVYEQIISMLEDGITVDKTLSSTSENAISNKVVTEQLNVLKSTITDFTNSEVVSESVQAALSDGIEKVIDDGLLDTVTPNMTTFSKFYYNLCNIESIENGYYWGLSNYIVTKISGNNVGTIERIKIKKNTAYQLRRLTSSFCYLAYEDGTSISKLNEYSGYTEHSNYSVFSTTVDCYLYMTYATNLSYSTAMIVEGVLPPYYIPSGIAYKKELFDYPVERGINNIEITVGNGKMFSQLTDAIALVEDGDAYNHTTIVLDDGSHIITSELNIPDFCNIVSASGDMDKCYVNYIPDSPSDYDVTTYSALRMDKNSKLRGITFTAINARYVVHSDSSNFYKDWIQELEKCRFIHYINTTGSWVTQCAWGGGASSGSIVTATECQFIAHSPTSLPFSVHNNIDYDKPFRHYFYKCDFISHQYGSFRCEGLASGTDDVVYAENCYFSSPIYMTNALTIKFILSGCNLVQSNSTNYFEKNSVAEYREYTKYIKNNTTTTIPKGTLVCYDGELSKVRPMLSTDNANKYAGFTIGDTASGELCQVITNGFYRYTENLTFGVEYGVDNGVLSQTADNKIGVCSGGGFIKIQSLL